ncbi:MAG: NAD-dependent epimerase/dehydratase family protein [Sphaerochaeta sp.]|jgi:UDP-glucuronate 4-epimerase|nr:NAD-dependent epimerase/dehydratase family protein [Sphaerochaeta sp.]
MNEHTPILVTGSAGFIGYHLTKALLANGNHVVGIDNLNDYYPVSLKEARLKELEAPLFTFHKVDIADEAALEELFVRYHFRYVVNLAAQAGVRYSITNPKAYLSSNLIGFLNILEACRHHGVEHLVYASSSSVYGLNEKVPYSTTDMVDNPVSLYAATKKSNELLAHAYTHLYGFASTGLRFFTVYGPWGRPDMAYYSFARAIREGKTIKVFNNGDMLRDFTYVDDIITALLKIIPSPPKENEHGDRYKVYNIGNNQPIKLIEFIETLEACIGKTADKEYLPMQAGDVYQTYADVDELVRDFDFRPNTPLKDGLSAFVDWFNAYHT